MSQEQKNEIQRSMMHDWNDCLIYSHCEVEQKELFISVLPKIERLAMQIITLP